MLAYYISWILSTPQILNDENKPPRLLQFQGRDGGSAYSSSYGSYWHPIVYNYQEPIHYHKTNVFCPSKKHQFSTGCLSSQLSFQRLFETKKKTEYYQATLTVA